MPSNEQKYVTRFHHKMGLPARDYPTQIDADEFKLRYSLIAEELGELFEAWIDSDIFEQIDALADILYTVYGYASTMGVDIQPFFQEVHRSNMTKQPGDGTARKIIKGHDYQEPDIAGVYERLYVHPFVDDDGTADDTVSLIA